MDEDGDAGMDAAMDDVDGEPMVEDDEDVDGVPMEDDEDGDVDGELMTDIIKEGDQPAAPAAEEAHGPSAATKATVAPTMESSPSGRRRRPRAEDMFADSDGE